MSYFVHNLTGVYFNVSGNFYGYRPKKLQKSIFFMAISRKTSKNPQLFMAISRKSPMIPKKQIAEFLLAEDW